MLPKVAKISGVFSTPEISGTMKCLERMTGGAFQFDLSSLVRFVNVR